jgi:hypothetical protein
MRKAFIAASAVALALGGCSTLESAFHKNSNSGTAANTKYQQSSPAYSGSSQAPSQTAQSSTPSSSSSSSQYNAPAAATEQSGSSHRMHRSSMNAEHVRQAQQKLKDDGEYTANVDGKWGPKTAQAVKQFQEKNGLKQTGRLDRNTMSKLGVGSTAGSGSSSSSSTGSSMGGSSSMGGNSSMGGSSSMGSQGSSPPPPSATPAPDRNNPSVGANPDTPHK